MSKELLAAVANKLPRIRSAVRREVKARLEQGAKVGAAIDGEVLSISIDKADGQKRARLLDRYGRSVAPLAKKSSAGRAGDAVVADMSRSSSGRR